MANNFVNGFASVAAGEFYQSNATDPFYWYKQFILQTTVLVE